MYKDLIVPLKMNVVEGRMGSSTHQTNKKGLMWLEELKIEHICDYENMKMVRIVEEENCTFPSSLFQWEKQQ